MTAPNTHKYRDPVERLHRVRAETPRYPDMEDPELAAAYRSLQLEWLRQYPEYKELIKQRLHEAAKRSNKLMERIERDYKEVDHLGREIDGCG
jgi:hypothetical protein